MEKAAAALLEGLNANGWVQLTSVVRYMEAYEEIAMRYNRIFMTLMGAVLALMVPAQGFAQTGTTDKTKAKVLPADPPTNVLVVPFGDSFDSLLVRWVEPKQGVDATHPPAVGDGATSDSPDDGFVHSTEGPLTGYRIYYAEDDTTITTDDLGPDAGSLLNASYMDVGVGSSGTVGGLDPGGNYQFRVATKNAIGVSITASTNDEMGPETGMVTDAPSPDRVIGVTIEPGDRMLMVNWTAPYAGHASLSIDSYEVAWSESADGDGAGTVMVTTNSAIISNLASNTAYEVEVTATNSADKTGDASLPVEATTAMGAPTMPEILTFLLAVTLVGAGVYVIRGKGATGLTPA